MNGKTARLLRRNGVKKETWNSLTYRRKGVFRKEIKALGCGEHSWNFRIKAGES